MSINLRYRPMMLPPHHQGYGTPMELEWEIPDGGATIILPFSSEGRYDCIVDWGDGDVSYADNDSGTFDWATHTYANSAGYPVRFTMTISGLCTVWDMRNNGNVNTRSCVYEVHELGDLGFESLHGAFYACENMQSCSGGVTDQCTDMGYMFYECKCSSLTISGIDDWNVGNVTDMSYMFAVASPLDSCEADFTLANWDVSKVTTMRQMFRCSDAVNLDVSGWDTSSCTDMGYMFYNVDDVTTLDVSGWDTSNVTDMGYMFGSCGVSSVNVSQWNVGSVEDMSYMFGSCSFVPNTTNWDTSSCTNMSNMFNGVTGNPVIGGFDMSNVTTIDSMCMDAVDIVPDLSGWDLSSCIYADNAFRGCTSMTATVPAEQFWHNPSIIDFDYCFLDSSSISNYEDIPGTWLDGDAMTLTLVLSSETSVTLPISSDGECCCHVDWDDGDDDSHGTETNMSWASRTLAAGTYEVEVRGYATVLSSLDTDSDSRAAITEVTDLGDLGWTNMSNGFYYCHNLTSVAGGDLSKVMDMSYMFYYCNELVTVGSGWNTSSCENMSCMFYNCSVVTPTTSSWTTTNVTNMSYMFYKAYDAVPAVSGWNVSSVIYMDGMFKLATSANPAVTSWNVSSVYFFNSMFEDATSATPNTTSWVTTSAQTMQSMFDGAESANPDVSGWDMSHVGRTDSMFLNAISAVPDVSEWDVSNITNMNNMFNGATSANPDVSGWVLSEDCSIITMSSAFNGCTSMTTTVPKDMFWHNGNITTFANCFTGATAIANYDDIPGVWKGVADPLELTLVLSTSTEVTLPIDGVNGECYCQVDWGDGTDTSGTEDDMSWATRTLDAGTYNISIDGYATHLNSELVSPDSREAITAVGDTGDLKWTSFESAFYGCSNLTSVTTGDMGDITTLEKAFRNCTSLVTLNSSGWDLTSCVTLKEIFYNCEVLNPTVTLWDTSAVEDMSYVFFGCDVAEPVVTDWDTSACTTMAGMFWGASLAEPDVGDWVTTNVTHMGWLFCGCMAADPDVSTWNVSSVTHMTNMFSSCHAADPDVSSWDVSSVAHMNGMFYGCWSADPDVSLWVTTSAENMNNMFAFCSIADPDVSGWDMSHVTDIGGMFNAAANADPDVSEWDTSSCQIMYTVFYNAISANPDVSGWDMSHVTDISQMFKLAISANPDISAWELDVCYSVTEAFNGCTSMTTTVPADQFWDNASIEEYTDCFTDSDNIANYLYIPIAWGGVWEPIDLVLQVTTTTDYQIVKLPLALTGSYDLTIDWGDGFPNSAGTDPSDDSWYTHEYEEPTTYTITVSGTADTLSTTELTTAEKSYITAVTTLGNLGWIDLSYAFAGCENLESFDETPAYLIEVTDIAHMFDGATSLDLSFANWELGAGTDVSYAFNGCVGITSEIPKDVFWHNIDITTFTECFTGVVNASNAINIPGTWRDGNSFQITYVVGAGDTVVLPFDETLSGGTSEYCCWVDWNGEASTSGTEADMSWAQHTFAGAGTKTVTVTGYATHLSHFNSTATIRDYVNTVPELGALGYTSLAYAFYYCTNLTTVLGGDTSSVTSMLGTFYGATDATPSTADWELGNVTTFNAMFRDAEAANPNTTNWDVSGAWDFIGMFMSTTTANPDVSNWDVSGGSYFMNTFNGAYGAVDLATGNWDMSNVVSIHGMFSGADTARPNVTNWTFTRLTTASSVFSWIDDGTGIDVSGWDMSKVTTIDGMFNGSALNPDVSGWQLDACLDADNAFRNCTSMTTTVPADQFWSRVSPAWSSYTDCFIGATNIANYGSIPSAWK